MMIESFKHGCSDDGKIMVDADEYNQLQARVKELEDLSHKQRALEAQLQGEINHLEAELHNALDLSGTRKVRVKELEAENAELLADFNALHGERDQYHEWLETARAESAELRERGAVFYALQKDENSVLMNLHTEQLEIYDTLRAARSAAKTGYRVVSIRICQNDEGEA